MSNRRGSRFYADRGHLRPRHRGVAGVCLRRFSAPEPRARGSKGMPSRQRHCSMPTPGHRSTPVSRRRHRHRCRLAHDPLGANRWVVRIPDDVKIEELPRCRCRIWAVGSTIRHLASGMSCGGVIALTRLGSGFQNRSKLADRRCGGCPDQLSQTKAAMMPASR